MKFINLFLFTRDDKSQFLLRNDTRKLIAVIGKKKIVESKVNRREQNDTQSSSHQRVEIDTPSR